MALLFLHKNLLQNWAYAAFQPIQLSPNRHLQTSLTLRLYSKNVNCDLKRNSILSLFLNYGLTDNQISGLIVKRPVLLSYDPEKHIKPKLDFFKSIAFSPSDLEDILTLDPFIFDRNLETQMIPSYQYLKSVLHKDEDVNFAIKRCTWVLKQDARQTIAPNVDVLRESGVPCDRILWTLKNHVRSLIQMPDKFMKITEEVKKMGFDPLTFNFLEAIRILTGGSDLISEKKKLYKKWCWSDEEVLTAFMKAPAFLIRSEKKVDNIMDFLVNKMGWNLSDCWMSSGVLS